MLQNQYISSTTTYQYLKPLGQGRMSQVVLVRDCNKNRLCALKMIAKELLQSVELNVKREILTQMNLNHKNIVKLYETFEDDDFLYIALEYCSGGTLKQQILSEDAVFDCFHQILDGVDYLHNQNVVHRDIKPENILLDCGTYKICDFGCATSLNQNDLLTPEQCGSLNYVAPEITYLHDHKVDIYSLGVVIYELLHGHLPLPEYVNERLNEDLQILLYAMLSKSSQRPTCKQIYLCKWFKKMMKEHKLFNKYEHEQLKNKHINKQVQIKTLYNCCFDLKQAAVSDTSSLIKSDSTTAPKYNSIQNSTDSLYEIPIVQSPANPQF